MLSSPSHQQQNDSLFPSSIRPASFVRHSTKFSSRECSVSSIISTTTKVRLVDANNRPADLGTFIISSSSSKLAPNQPQGHSAELIVPLRPPPPLKSVSLSNKITVLPVTKPFSASAGEVRYIPIKQLVTPTTMPLLPSSVGTASASSPASSSAASPSVRPLRVAQPPPLATAFPSCSSAIPMSPNFVEASSSAGLSNFISVPSLPKPTIPFHRSVASSSEIGGNRMVTANKQQNPPGLSNCRGDRGRSRFMQMSYEEMLELARNQQQQIETNEEELDERRKAVALFGVAKRTAANQSEQQQNARMLMSNLRVQISHDELEMAHLGKRQKEAKKLREHNEKQSRELAQLESEYGHDEEQLRRAVAKVDSLRRQLEMLYQRRAVAADTAVLHHRQINLEGSAEKSFARVEKRPKASVVPYKQENGEESVEFEGEGRGVTQRRKDNGEQQQQLPQKQFLSSVQPPINWRRTTPQVDQFSIKRNSMTALKRLSWVAENGGDEYLMHFVVNEQKKGRTHISFGEMVPKPPVEMSEKERIGTNERRETEATDNAKGEQQLLTAFKGLRRVIGEGERSDRLDILTLGVGQTEVKGRKEEEKQTKTLLGEERTAQQQPEDGKGTDQKDGGEERSDWLDTAKGSSPMKKVAVQENCWEFHKKFAEKLTNKMAKDDKENEKEKTGTIEKNKEEKSDEGEERESATTEEDEREKKEEEKCEEGKEEEEKKWEDEEVKSAEKRVEENEEEESKYEGGEEEKVPKGTETADDDEKEEKSVDLLCSSPPADEMTTDESSSSSAGEEPPIVFEESTLALPQNVKGILRRQSSTIREEKKRRVMFDLIVLFLDVAYEGQYDTLVELASKIEDISISNSEGTTALHYAICAGNFDIVKFLIEKGADVNALDVDGWSPLHCAASCNNPKMLRQLIENGACPFATTFGMSETATQLFDETLDFAVAADYMEMVENCMGMLNDGKVYAAYSYEAENEDELSFLEGDELRVLRKSELNGAKDGEQSPGGEEEADEDGTDNAHLWWLCEHCASGDKGLVPRNYLGLYPTWKFRSRYSTDFELPRPSHSITEQNEDRTAEEGWERDGEGISNGQGDDRESQRELSTYA